MFAIVEKKKFQVIKRVQFYPRLIRISPLFKNKTNNQPTYVNGCKKIFSRKKCIDQHQETHVFLRQKKLTEKNVSKFNINVLKCL